MSATRREGVNKPVVRLISYDGRFEKAERVRLNPAPSRQIPIWIGGFAQQATERAGRLGSSLPVRSISVSR